MSYHLAAPSNALHMKASDLRKIQVLVKHPDIIDFS